MGELINQVIVIQLLFAIGFAVGKMKILSKDTCNNLSNLLVNIINPAVIVMSFQIEYSQEKLNELLITFLLAILAFAIMIGFSYFFYRDSNVKGINRLAMIYPNCGFVGIPIVSSIFGTGSIFYLSIFIAVFNIFFWTHGVYTIRGGSGRKEIVKQLLSPTIISIAVGIMLFVFGIRIPAVIGDVLNEVAKMNTPLALMVCGASIVGVNFKEALKNINVYIICLFRLLIMPLLVFSALYFINVPVLIKSIVVIASACPVGASVNILAINEKSNYQLAAEYLGLTTALCPFSILAVSYLVTTLY